MVRLDLGPSGKTVAVKGWRLPGATGEHGQKGHVPTATGRLAAAPLLLQPTRAGTCWNNAAGGQVPNEVSSLLPPPRSVDSSGERVMWCRGGSSLGWSKRAPECCCHSRSGSITSLGRGAWVVGDTMTGGGNGQGGKPWPRGRDSPQGGAGVVFFGSGTWKNAFPFAGRLLLLVVVVPPTPPSLVPPPLALLPPPLALPPLLGSPSRARSAACGEGISDAVRSPAPAAMSLLRCPNRWAGPAPSPRP
mmetsp:Transcript_2900/g.8261  ORF Transcript_2900/g.8261 Transcript_2900/m.8261 type:complete len:247 (+) Transcript_2900:1105-1845(+)